MFGHHENQELDIIQRLTKNESKLIDLLEQATKSSRKPILTLGTFINNKFYLMADIQLTLGGKPQSGVFTLTDNKTGAVVTGTFTNQAIGANSNPTAATFALDGNNNVVPTALAVGTGTVVISCHAAYTDPGDQSAQEGDFTVSKAFTVKAGQDGVSLDIVFS